MNACPTPAIDEFELPDSEALHAATLALMTGHAQQTCPQRRSLMARKIKSNLFFLSKHPGLSAELRRVVQRLHGMWEALVKAEAPAEPMAAPVLNDDLLLPEARLWHPPAALLQ